MSLDPAVVTDLTSCDREPITRLDLIQDFGFLIALANDWTVVRASANLGDFLGIEADVAIGSNFAAMTDAGAQEEIRQRLRRLQSSDNERLFGIRLVAGLPLFDVNLHLVGDLLIIEGERSSSDDPNVAASMVASMMAKLGRMPALDGFHRLAARQVRELSGFDRVMVYRFDPAGNGEVIADATGPRQ